MKLKLIMLDNPIIVSDENMVIGGIAYSKTFDNICNITKTALRGIEEDNNDEGLFKILAGFSKLPSIDFSALSEKDCKKIGLFNIEALAKEGYKKHEPKHEITFDENVNRVGGYNVGFKEGFLKAQSLNDKKFSLDDLERAYDSGRYSIIHKNIEETFESFIQSISEPKVFDIEINMMLQTRHGVEWYDLPNQTEGREPDGIYRRIPRIENNSIKITKIN